jgi:Txe/YoeB family toxin of Txe-Axe toxin-antitoxin module
LYGNKQEAKKQYQIKISNSFAAWQNLNDNEDINRAFKKIVEEIKTSPNDSLGLYEMKQCKP